MSSRFSHTANPILKRYEAPAKGDGFAYAEGQSAYTQAAGGDAGTQSQFESITAGGGARLTFADVVVKKVKPKVNGNDGLVSLKIFAAITKSAKTGKKIRI